MGLPAAGSRRLSLLGFHPISEVLVGLHLLKDCVAMVVEIGERCMNLCERNVRILASNLLGREPVPLVIGDDVLDADSCATDERPRLPVPIWAKFNVSRGYRLHAHTLSLSHTRSLWTPIFTVKK
jgi:hypothetical protein